MNWFQHFEGSAVEGGDEIAGEGGDEIAGDDDGVPRTGRWRPTGIYCTTPTCPGIHYERTIRSPPNEGGVSDAETDDEALDGVVEHPTRVQLLRATPVDAGLGARTRVGRATGGSDGRRAAGGADRRFEA